MPQIAGAEDKPAESPSVDFIRDIKPLFQRHCFRCHGAEKQQSGYRLDIRDVALRGGDAYAPNIVAGKSAASHLVQFVAGGGDTVMPPLGEGERLAAAEVTLLRNWVDQGAIWPDAAAGKIADKADWWSFQPLPKAASPRFADPQTGNAIDAFVLQKLRSKQLSPAPAADSRTLVRRLYFDLIGLPPTPDEAAEFLGDPSPDAYERLVDQLLASPAHGERWARHWLDAAHFAETHGHDQDRIREHAWPYRDYLIQALNSDLPYRQFILDQVAGDVASPENPAATAALGFLAGGPWDESTLSSIREDTLDRQNGRYIDRDDMLTTVVNNFCSLTVQCARCHDHKFDPVSQQDYYALQAVFAGVERANRAYDPDPRIHARRRLLGQQRERLQKRDPQLAPALLAADGQQRVAAWEAELAQRVGQWQPLDPISVISAEGATLEKQADLSVYASGKKPEKDTYTLIAAPTLPRITGLRLEVLADDRLPQKGPGRQDNGNLHLAEFRVYLEGRDAPLSLVHPVADFDQTDWGIAKAIDGNVDTAWGVHPQVGKSHQATFELAEPLSLAPGAKLRIVLAQLHGRQHLIGRFRLAVTAQPPPIQPSQPAGAVIAILATPREQRTPQQILELTYLCELDSVERELARLPKPKLIYAAASEFAPDGGLRPPGGPRPVHLLHRGDIRQPRDLATPGAISCLPDLPSRFTNIHLSSEAARRDALARWIADPRNPLTWRSIVNRVWHHHFGRGLAAAINDFGHMGEIPSHPELLDWLAADFRDSDQQLKKLHRRIVASAAYRRGSRAAPDASRVDGDNRLLWRMNRTRLDAECVRDAIVAITGRLDRRMGGPSDRHFQLLPGNHVTPKIDYALFDHGGAAGARRSVYRFLFRTLPDPFMETLDCPSGEQITPGRINSVTVQQALALWNDGFVTRHCELAAARLEAAPGSLADKTALAVQLAFVRPARADELRDLTAYAQKHGLANLWRLLFNSNEFLFVE